MLIRFDRKDLHTYSILELSYSITDTSGVVTNGILLIEPETSYHQTSSKRWSVHFPWGTEVLSGSFDSISRTSGYKLFNYYSNKDRKIPDELSTEKRSRWLHSTS